MVAREKVALRQVDNLTLVKKCIAELDSDDCKLWAIDGWQKLFNAKPVVLE